MKRALPKTPGAPVASPGPSTSGGDARRGLPGQDLVLAALARALVVTLADPDSAASPLFLDQLLQALRIHLRDRYGDPRATRRQRQG